MRINNVLFVTVYPLLQLMVTLHGNKKQIL